MDINSILLVAITIAVVIIVPVLIKVNINNKKSVQKGNNILGDGNIQQHGDRNTHITIGTQTNNFINSPQNQKDVKPTVDRIKNELKVIFVDDKKFNVVDLLRKSGWKQVVNKKDILDLDAPDIREAHVFFLDINGVGVAMGFPNQGMGLCGAIKRKYGDKKRVVLYSGETDGSIFDSDAKMADDTLKKDSDLYQFTVLMEQYGKELL